MALSDAFNEELHDLADAGCQVIQMEEPQIHLLAARGYVDKVINPEFMLKVFNNTVKGLRAKTEVWCHTCWGNPSQQRMFAKVQSYTPALELLNQVDADVITFEMKSSNAIDLEAVGEAITEKKVCIGVIDHHTLQVESADEVADLIRPGIEGDSIGAAGGIHRLRHGTRGDEPSARVLQDRRPRSRNQRHTEGTWAPRGREPGRQPEVLAHSNGVITVGGRRSAPPPGRLVSVGNHRLHIRCDGDGSPTVIFDAALGGSSLSWSLVHPSIARITRACSYDRAGFGWSEAGPLPRTAGRIADELHTLLRVAAVPAPYVLVGHSFGGLVTRLYTHRVTPTR